MGQPLLITGNKGEAWVAAASAVSESQGYALRTMSLNADEGPADVQGLWAAERGLTPEGALLVRPDNHVAWRSAGRSPDPRAALLDALHALHFKVL